MVQKSCTSWYVVYPIVYRVFCIPGGDRRIFEPSPVESSSLGTSKASEDLTEWPPLVLEALAGWSTFSSFVCVDIAGWKTDPRKKRISKRESSEALKET